MLAKNSLTHKLPLTEIQICSWMFGSTNAKTGRSELPMFCKKQGCPALFGKFKPVPDCFYAYKGVEKCES